MSGLAFLLVIVLCTPGLLCGLLLATLITIMVVLLICEAVSDLFARMAFWISQLWGRH